MNSIISISLVVFSLFLNSQSLISEVYYLEERTASDLREIKDLARELCFIKDNNNTEKNNIISFSFVKNDNKMIIKSFSNLENLKNNIHIDCWIISLNENNLIVEYENRFYSYDPKDPFLKNSNEFNPAQFRDYLYEWFPTGYVNLILYKTSVFFDMSVFDWFSYDQKAEDVVITSHDNFHRTHLYESKVNSDTIIQCSITYYCYFDNINKSLQEIEKNINDYLQIDKNLDLDSLTDSSEDITLTALLRTRSRGLEVLQEGKGVQNKIYIVRYITE